VFEIRNQVSSVRNLVSDPTLIPCTNPTERQLSRRDFLRIGGLALATLGALLTGCRPSTSDRATSGDNTALNREGALAAATPTAQTGTAQAAVPTATPAATGTVYVACPRGLVNDPYPGHCKLYRDTNGNGYCDWSVPGSGNVPAGQTGAPSGGRPRR